MAINSLHLQNEGAGSLTHVGLARSTVGMAQKHGEMAPGAEQHQD